MTDLSCPFAMASSSTHAHLPPTLTLFYLMRIELYSIQRTPSNFTRLVLLTPIMADSATPINPYEGLPRHDKRKWVCVYPAYLNSRKTVKQGRRIAKSKAIDNPTCPEIRDVCISQNLNAELEQKHYPRDPQRDQIHTGRVRVQLVNEDGDFCSDGVHTRQQLYQMIVEFIPKLKTRQAGSGGGAEAKGTASASKKKKKKK